MKRKQVMAFLLAVAMVAGNVAIVPESVDAATTTEYLTEVTAPHVHGDDCYAEGTVKLGTADLTGKVGNDYQPLTEEGYYTSQTVIVYTKAAITNPSNAVYDPEGKKWEITETTKDVTEQVRGQLTDAKAKYYTVEDIQAVEGAESDKQAGFYSVGTYTKLTDSDIYVDGENVHLYVSPESQAAIRGDNIYLGSDELEGKTDTDDQDLKKPGWYTVSDGKYTAAEDPTPDYATFNAETKNWYLKDPVTIGVYGDLYIKATSEDEGLAEGSYYQATELEAFTPTNIEEATPSYNSETQKWSITGSFKKEVNDVVVQEGAEYLSDGEISDKKDENGQALPGAGFYVKDENFTLYTEATPNDPSADTTNYKIFGDQNLTSEQIDQIITKDGKQYLDLSNIIVTGVMKQVPAEVQDVSSDPSAFNSNVILTLGNGDGYEIKVTTNYNAEELTYDGTTELTNSAITDLHGSLSTFKLWTDSDEDNLIDAGELKEVSIENLGEKLPKFKVFNKQVYKDVDKKLTVSGFDLKTEATDGYTQIAETGLYIKDTDLANCMNVYGIYDGFVEGAEGDYSKLLTSSMYTLTATDASVGENGQGTVTVKLSIDAGKIGNTEAIEKTYEVAAYTDRVLNSITAEICYADNNKKYIFKGEELTNDAFCVKADFGDLGIYTLGTSEYEISGADTSSIGTKEITVTAKADSEKKATVNCTVVDVKPESLQATYPKTSLVEGSVINLNDIQATVVLYDGTNDVDRVSVKPSEFRSGLEPAGLGKLKIAKGENKITVMWQDQSCELKITGTAKPSSVTPSYPDPTPSTPDPSTPTTDKPADTKPTDTKPADTTPAESNTITTNENGAQIIVGTDGEPVANKVVAIDGEKYITNDAGVIVKNDFATTAKGNKVFTDVDGKIVTDKTIVVDGKKYVAKESGALAVSEVVTTAKGNKVYCDATGAVVTDKTIKVDGKKYVAKENGVLAVSEMVTTAKGNKVYCGKTGAIVTGKSFKVDGKRYVASKTGAIVTSKWVKVGDKAYYCDKNGVVTKVKPAKKK